MSDDDSRSTGANEHLSLTRLKARGWTDSLIRDFLGAPDATAPNPYRRYRSAVSVKLYRLSRIITAENTPEWQARRQRSSFRRAAAVAGMARRAEALLDEVLTMPLSVVSLPQDELLKRAIEHYNALGPRNERDWPDWHSASANNDRAFLERIQVNYARHALTSYDHAMDLAAGKPGADVLRSTLRERIFDAISDTYPHLSAECERQVKVAREREEYTDRR